MHRLDRDVLAYLLELTPLDFCSLRNIIVARAIRGGKIYKIVANPGGDLVHETFRIGKGGWGKADCGNPRSRTA